jgi:hypothetical protein
LEELLKLEKKEMNNKNALPTTHDLPVARDLQSPAKQYKDLKTENMMYKIENNRIANPDDGTRRIANPLERETCN